MFNLRVEIDDFAFISHSEKVIELHACLYCWRMNSSNNRAAIPIIFVSSQMTCISPLEQSSYQDSRVGVVTGAVG